MKTKTTFTATMAAALLIAFAGTMYAIPTRKDATAPVACKVCKMWGIKDAELAQHQRAIAKTIGKKICPNCAGLASAARFSKDGTIFQGQPDVLCSGCDKKGN